MICSDRIIFHPLNNCVSSKFVNEGNYEENKNAQLFEFEIMYSKCTLRRDKQILEIKAIPRL
jgi:hypothetical protein